MFTKSREQLESELRNVKDVIKDFHKTMRSRPLTKNEKEEYIQATEYRLTVEYELLPGLKRG